MVAGAETVVRVSLFLLAMLATTVHARGVSPYLPVDISPEIERKIERVLILADQPSLRRPIAAATVLDALPRACERDAALCEDVRRYLASLTRTAGISYASLTAVRRLGRRYGAAESARHDLAKQLRSRHRRVLATRRLLSRDGRRARVRGRGDADRHRRQLRRAISRSSTSAIAIVAGRRRWTTRCC